MEDYLTKFFKNSKRISVRERMKGAKEEDMKPRKVRFARVSLWNIHADTLQVQEK